MGNNFGGYIMIMITKKVMGEINIFKALLLLVYIFSSLSAQRPISIIEKKCELQRGFKTFKVSQYSINVNDDYKLENESPTLAYLNEVSGVFRESILNTYHKDDAINDLITMISKEKIESIANAAIEKELELHKEHYLSVHGMKMEHLLYQDLFSQLFALCQKKVLKNFFMLRNPLGAKNYTNLKDLSKNECNGGALSDFAKLEGMGEFLLSVVPSLFSYMYSLEEECSAFFYFLKSHNVRSASVNETLMRYKMIFDYFGIKKELFEKYKNILKEMLEILQKKESDTTGLLLQIFIPKKSANFSINDIAYPVLFTGYKDADTLEINKHKKVSDYLDFLPVHYALNYLPSKARDQIQMRLYLKPELFLNSSNPGKIKMFRYYNKTKSIEKYEELFKEFAKKLAHDLEVTFQKKPDIEIKKHKEIIEKGDKGKKVEQKIEEESDNDRYCIVS
jgi:hypothetical protein